MYMVMTMSEEKTNTCPRCISEKFDDVQAAWENGTREKYDEIREEFEQVKEDERMSVTQFVNLHRDEDGDVRLHVDYCAVCQVCGFEASVNEDLEVETDE